MCLLLTVGDPDGQVSACFVAQELLREVFAATDEAHARRRMIAFYILCADADIGELTRLAQFALTIALILTIKLIKWADK